MKLISIENNILENIKSKISSTQSNEKNEKKSLH